MADIVAGGFIILKQTDSLSETPNQKTHPEFDGRNYEFLLLQNKAHEEWGFPKGHKDGDEEKIAECAWRELREETNLKPENVKLVADRPLRIEYDVNLENESGKKQVYYFIGEMISGVPIISMEHTDYGFFNPADTHEMVKHESLQVLVRYVCQNHKSI